MLISVIITTKNEERHIEECLNSVNRQNYPRHQIEIIVVDNNSTDRTKEIALKYTNLVFNKGPERSAQRNFGVKKSSGEYFIFLDADMILSENLIRDCVKKVRKSPEVIACYITEIVTGEKFFSKVRRFERSFYDATVIDCARFIKKDAFLQAGEFDEGLTGPEDWDLDKRLRNIGRIDLIKTPIYHNESECNLRRYLKKKSYYSKSFDAYIAKWGADDRDLKKQLGIYYRFIGVFTEKGKWKKLLVHPVLTAAMYSLRLFVGVKFLMREQ